MYSLAHFPGVYAKREHRGPGMLFRIDAKTLLQLDKLEGHPNWYKRKMTFCLMLMLTYGCTSCRPQRLIITTPGLYQMVTGARIMKQF